MHKKLLPAFCLLICVFHSLFLIISSTTTTPHAQPSSSSSSSSPLALNFSFPTFATNDPNLTFPNHNHLNLASSIAPFLQLSPTNHPNSTGRAFYRLPLHLWSTASPDAASFNTSFRFRIKNTSAEYYGDGLTFLLCASMPIPENSSGLGLFNATNNRTVAVEFDTFKDDFDKNANHVGVDVKGTESVESRSLAPWNIDLKSGKDINAWIDYSGQVSNLDVYVAYAGSVKPQNTVLSYNISLQEFLPEYVFVGFSASTRGAQEKHTIISWNFTSTIVTTPERNSSKLPVIIGLSIAITVASIVAVAGCITWQKRVKSRLHTAGSNTRPTLELSGLDQQSEFAYGPRRFTYKQLSVATKSFSQKEFLGKGGFGPVYRGILPGDMTLVAVKCVSESSIQKEREFVAEVSIISRIRHRNLVQLQGWCHEKGKLLLVYDYMPNGSLDKYLFSKEGHLHLNWNRRYEIIRGLAAAVLYLHEDWEHQVIHRDIKAGNVMLDAEFNAKLSDFGLARLVEHDRLPKTTTIAGTLGYLAPEYAETGKATAESDVYSFGAVALEVACGRRPLEFTLPPNETRLVDWVWHLHGQGRVLDAADPKLEGEFDTEEMNRLLIVGLACSHPDPKSRPTIRQAHASLIGQVGLLAIPQTKPVAFYRSMPFLSKSVQEVLSSETYSSSSIVATSSSINTQTSSSSASGSFIARSSSTISTQSSSSSTTHMEKPLLFHDDDQVVRPARSWLV